MPSAPTRPTIPWWRAVSSQAAVALVGRVADDDVGRDRAFDGVERTTDLVATLAERGADRLDPLGRAEAVPDVGVAGCRAQGLGRARTADEDRQPSLDGEGSGQSVTHRVVATFVAEPLAVEEPADEPDRLVEPVEPVAETLHRNRGRTRRARARTSRRRARGPSGRRDRWSMVVASLAVRPGLRKVLAPTSSPSRTRVVRVASAASVAQPSSFESVSGPSSVRRWSSTQIESQPAASAARQASRRSRPRRPVDPERRAEPHVRIVGA